jgi:hypothetical protein
MDGWEYIPRWGKERLIQPRVWKGSTNVLLFCPEDIKGISLELSHNNGLYSEPRLM